MRWIIENIVGMVYLLIFFKFLQYIRPVILEGLAITKVQTVFVSIGAREE